MHNPFEILNKRLETIEELLNRLTLQSSKAQQAAPIVGPITIAEEVTGLSKARIYALVTEKDPAKRLPHAKRGNRLYFNRADLLQWVADGNRSAAA